MGYQTAAGEWADTRDITLADSAARVANGNGTALELGDRGTVRATLDITAVAGTGPTLDVVVETSSDNATWRTLGTFPQKNAVGAQRLSFGGADRFVRGRWTIGGTSPSFTFSLIGEAC